MTAPPLPESPCVRVRLLYTNSDGHDAGSRFFLSYAGSTPSTADLNTLASDVGTQWGTDIAPQMHQNWVLSEVDILDITSTSGNSGSALPNTPGGVTGTVVPANCAVNVEYDIARRYRGGKPRIFWPTPNDSALANAATWTTAYVAAMDTATSNFFSGIQALSIGSMGSLKHVSLSYYSGFKNVTNSSGRTRAAPTYRTSALVDQITGYATKVTIGSQRRRRTASTF